MGYIQQSDIKKIHAYLTQKGKEKFITGDTVDFQVAYFSLHDEDVNYKIASQLISASTYNTLKSGFISDITGNNDFCSPNISESALLKNNLIYFPPFQGEYLVNGTCSTDPNKEQFEITVSKNGVFEGYTFNIITETITFPNSNSTIEQAQVLKTETSESYSFDPVTVGNTTVAYKKITLNATCKRIIKDNTGANPIYCLLDDDFLPRKADAFNFIVEVKDSSGQVGFTKRFDNINCSRKLYMVTRLDSNNLPADVPYNAYTSPMAELESLKAGYAIIKVDNGNRRSDLNMTQADIDYFYNIDNNKVLENSFALDLYYDGTNEANSKTPDVATFPDYNAGSIPIDFDGRNLEDTYIYSNQGFNPFYVKQTVPTFIPTPLITGTSFADYAPDVTQSDSVYSNNLPQSYNSSTFTERLSPFHLTVRLFENWKNGSTGFQIRYVEVTTEIYSTINYATQNPAGGTLRLRRILKNMDNLTYNSTLNTDYPKPNAYYSYLSDGQKYIYGSIIYDSLNVTFEYCYPWGVLKNSNIVYTPYGIYCNL